MCAANDVKHMQNLFICIILMSKYNLSITEMYDEVSKI